MPPPGRGPCKALYGCHRCSKQLPFLLLQLPLLHLQASRRDVHRAGTSEESQCVGGQPPSGQEACISGKLCQQAGVVWDAASVWRSTKAPGEYKLILIALHVCC